MSSAGVPKLENGAYHVRPGQNIQDAIELASEDPAHKTVRVHEGLYFPNENGQALVWFNAKHDGVVLEAEGDVTLTAANAEIADREAASFPAVVNHVVYFGDGVTRKTVFRGFKITGANRFAIDKGQVIEPRLDALKKTEGFYGRLFFYTDGGGIKIFGQSYPTIESVELFGNDANPCAGAVSIEQRGFNKEPVLLQNCIFRENRCLITGSAVDLLPGSAAEISNCLFAGNLSNRGIEFARIKGNLYWPEIPRLMKNTVNYQPKHGSGALTVFPGSRVAVERCTFIGNFNGADDKGKDSVYRHCIFWMNTAEGGARSGDRYELDILHSGGVENCFIKGKINDLRGVVDPTRNKLDCPDPQFDEHFRPRHTDFSGVGYRPLPKK